MDSVFRLTYLSDWTHREHFRFYSSAASFGVILIICLFDPKVRFQIEIFNSWKIDNLRHITPYANNNTYLWKNIWGCIQGHPRPYILFLSSQILAKFFFAEFSVENSWNSLNSWFCWTMRLEIDSKFLRDLSESSINYL